MSKAALCIGTNIGCLVLTYHRISDTADLDDSLCVSRGVFDKQMMYIKDTYRVLTGDEFGLIIHQRQPFPKRSCLITFDDGWQDNYRNAYPILQRYQLPAVIFLATDFIGTDNSFWHETLERALLRTSPEAAVDRLPLVGSEIEPALYDSIETMLRLPSQGRRSHIYGFVEQLKRKEPRERARVCDYLTKVLGIRESRQSRSMLSWQEVQEMAQDRICFGAHTKGHSILTQVSLPEVEQEVRGSKEVIERYIGRPVTLFCYPNGNYNKEIIEVVQNAGYWAAVTCNPGYCQTDDPPFELKRLNVLESMSLDPWGRFTRQFFAAELSGVRMKIRDYFKSDPPSVVP